VRKPRRTIGAARGWLQYRLLPVNTGQYRLLPPITAFKKLKSGKLSFGEQGAKPRPKANGRERAQRSQKKTQQLT
jgi:hypothetical protein